MARKIKKNTAQVYEPKFKRTQLAVRRPKTSTMNKNKKRTFKKYRKQGR
jgi:hypothetical protein